MVSCTLKDWVEGFRLEFAGFKLGVAGFRLEFAGFKVILGAICRIQGDFRCDLLDSR